MVVHISLQFHPYDIILNFMLRYFFKLPSHFSEWILFIRPFWLPNCCFLILQHHFSCFIANVFFISGPLSNLTSPTFNVQRRIPLSFHPLGKRKSSDCLSSGTAQVSPFYKALFFLVHRNIRRWMNTPSHSVAIGQPFRHIGWGRRKNYSLFDQHAGTIWKTSD